MSAVPDMESLSMCPLQACLSGSLGRITQIAHGLFNFLVQGKADLEQQRTQLITQLQEKDRELIALQTSAQVIAFMPAACLCKHWHISFTWMKM